MKAKRFLCLILPLLLIVSILPNRILAQDIDKHYFVKKDQYNYRNNDHKDAVDEYLYYDGWFNIDASNFNPELALFSSQIAMASASYYNEEHETVADNNDKYILEILNALKFEDVQTNKYYNLEKLENSAGVALGHKTIDDYTLLAIIPRSAGYKQEWVGNFTVGENNLHEGFKHGRDEILRFVKNYVEENNIEGKIKVWTAGHSRGGALANDIAGFFAESKAVKAYLNLDIETKDLYAYTFATPSVIPNNAKKKDVYSVEAYRGVEYKDDSEGEAFIYDEADKDEIINPSSDLYKTIYNFIPNYDIIAKLPPTNWDGFTIFGQKYINTTFDLKYDRELFLKKLEEY